MNDKLSEGAALPCGWERCTLPDFTRIVMGQSPDSKTYNHSGEGLPFFQGKAEFGNLYPTIKLYCSKPKKVAEQGATLLSVRAPVGPTNLAQFECCIGRGLVALHPCEGIEPKFVLYLLRSIEPVLSRQGTGSTFKAVTKGFIENLEFNLPPLAEQNRIVSKIQELFSELDKGVESLEKAREQLKVYRQAVLKHAFEGKLTARWREENKDKLETPEQLLARIKREREKRYEQQLNDWKVAVKEWEAEGKIGKKPLRPALFIAPNPLVQSDLAELLNIPKLWQYVRLSEIAQIGSGMSISKSRKLEIPFETPYLSVANVQRGKLDLSAVKSMKIECSQLHRLALKQWDVLFNEGGDRDKLGRGWVWESQIEPCITQNHVFRASPFLKSHQHSKWISYWGNIFGQLYFETHGKQTTNLASINKTVLSKFPIPLPPIEEQKEIIRRLESQTSMIDHLEEDITSSIGRLNTLRQSILRRAYVGRLASQDPNDEPASTLLDRIRIAKNAKNPRAQL